MQKCYERYIGETKRNLKERLDEHRRHIRNDVQNATENISTGQEIVKLI